MAARARPGYEHRMRPVLLLPLLPVLLGPVLLGAAPAATFDLTFDALRTRLDAAIREDAVDPGNPEGSTIKACEDAGEARVCSFNDADFQATVDGFHDLKLMQGPATQLLALRAELTGGKVARIVVTGDRRDPANLAQFGSTVIDVMRVFAPAVARDEAATVAVQDRLGLLRDDRAPDLGRERVGAEPYARIACLASPAAETRAVRCTLTPR